MDPNDPAHGTSALETEFKFLVDGEAAFEALASTLGGVIDPPVLQRNHFYDTPAGALRRARFALRLREEPDRTTLTAKGPKREGAGGPELTVRPEVEVELTEDEAHAIREGRRSPLGVLEERVAASSDLLGAMRAVVGEAELIPSGSFVNHRRRLGPLPLGAGGPGGAGELVALFELDRTELPGGRIDHEIEVEVAEGEAAAFRDALLGLLERAGIRWRPSRSKVARMFAALEDEESSGCD